MKVQITARHYRVSDALQQNIQDEMDRLERFYDRVTKCHVILTEEDKTRRIAEITIGASGRTIVGKANAEIMGKAIDEAIEKVERQLKKFNEKKHTHRPAQKGPAEEAEGEEEYAL